MGHREPLNMNFSMEGPSLVFLALVQYGSMSALEEI